MVGGEKGFWGFKGFKGFKGFRDILNDKMKRGHVSYLKITEKLDVNCKQYRVNRRGRG